MQQTVFESLRKRFEDATEEEEKAHAAIDSMVAISKKRQRQRDGEGGN